MSDNQVKTHELKELISFKSCNESQLEVLSRQMVRRNFLAGQFIFFEGEDTNGLWFVLTGTVKIMKQSQNGRLQGLCMLNRGKCFGSCPLFDGETNPADAQALSAVSLAILPRLALQDLIYADIALAKILMRTYNERTSLLAKLGECLGTWTVPMRINDCLIANAKTNNDETIVKLSHEEIATLVGTAREVVSRHLSSLEQEGVVETSPNRICILDLSSLHQACQGQSLC